MSVAKVGLPLLAAVLIVGAGVTTLWLIGSASGERAKFSSLDIAPKEADAFFAINTDPTSPQWLAVNDSLGAVGAKDPIRDAIDEALAEVNLDWEEDILPVAGDEAFFSVPSFDEVDDTTGFIAGFQIANEDKAEEVFDSLRERAEDEGEELAEEEYEGVTIYHTEVEDIGLDSGDQECEPGQSGALCFTSEDETSGAVALFDEVLAIGGSTDDVKSVIDVVQGRAPSAKENERLTEFREAQRGDFLMWGYADLASVWEMLEEGIATDFGLDGSGGGFVPIETPEPTVTPRPLVEPDDSPGSWTMDSMDVEYALQPDGSADVIERFRVTFDSHKHGIMRVIPTHREVESGGVILVEPRDITVSRDGEPETFEPAPVDYGLAVRTGAMDQFLIGTHEYEIRYHFPFAVQDGDDERLIGDEGNPDIFRGDVTGPWENDLESVTAKVTLPTAGISDAFCEIEPEQIASCELQLDASGAAATLRVGSPLAPESRVFVTVEIGGAVLATEPGFVEESDPIVPLVQTAFTPVDRFVLPTDSGAPATPQPSAAPQPTETRQPVETAAPTTDFRVTSFNAEYAVQADGEVFVKETIAVDFGAAGKDGFVRRIPKRVDYDFESDAMLGVSLGLLSPDSPAVTRDGLIEGYTGVPRDDYLELTIQNPDGSLPGQDGALPGEHVYEIRYMIQGAVHEYDNGPGFPYYELLMNATGDWGVPIEDASVTVVLPGGEVLDAVCNVEPDAAGLFNVYNGSECNADFGGQQAIFTAQTPIEPGTGLGFLVSVEGEIDTPPVELVPDDNFNFDFDGDQFDDEFDFEDEPLIPFDFDTEELFEQLKGTYDRVGFSVSSTSDGFAFDVTVLHADGFEPEFAFEPEQAFDSHFAETVSADTMFFFAGYDIYGQNWLPAKEWFEDVEFTDGKTLDDYLEDFSDETGLDLEEDILALLTGEYAVAGDVSDWDQDTPDFNILALVDVADANRAQDTLDELGNYLEDQGMVSVDASDPIQEWTFLEDSDIDAIGVTEDDGAVIIGYPVSAVEDAVDGHASSLADTEEWRRTVGLLPDDTTSIGFLSLARILDEASKVEDFEDGLEEATDGDITVEQLRALRSVGYATTSRENGFGVHFVLFVEER